MEHLALGEFPVPSLEWMTLVVVDVDVQVHLMHSFFSVWINGYLK